MIETMQKKNMRKQEVLLVANVSADADVDDVCAKNYYHYYYIEERKQKDCQKECFYCYLAFHSASFYNFYIF